MALLRRILLCGAMAAGLVAVGSPAGATQFQCTFYLAAQGYSGLIVDIGCAYGTKNQPVLCVGSLRIAGVPQAIAEEGCRRAAL